MAVIFCPRGIKPNAGGPAGYVYSLKMGLEKIGSNIEVVAPMLSDAGSASNKRRYIPVLSELRSIAFFFKMGFRFRRQYEPFSDEELIHVHSVGDVFYLRKFLGYRGKVLLTPHCPEPIWSEKASAFRAAYGTKSSCRLLKAFYVRIEKYGYKHCDAYIFPSPHAKEIYKSFPGFEKAGEKATAYVITGCPAKNVSLSRADYRDKHQIKRDDFVVAYIGRHNEVKGYDLLVESCNRDFHDGSVTFVCAGSTAGVTIPNHKNWIELGYINDSQNLMSACDVLAVPNRTAYFDLIIVEALSQGSIVVSTNVGGTQDVISETDGIIAIDSASPESLSAAIKAVRILTPEERDRMSASNKSYYAKHCTLESFARSYQEAIAQLVEQLR